MKGQTKYEKTKYNQPEHFLIFEKLHTLCTHNSSCFYYFWIFLDINFNKMYILIKFVYHLLPEVKQKFCTFLASNSTIKWNIYIYIYMLVLIACTLQVLVHWNFGLSLWDKAMYVSFIHLEPGWLDGIFPLFIFVVLLLSFSSPWLVFNLVDKSWCNCHEYNKLGQNPLANKSSIYSTVASICLLWYFRQLCKSRYRDLSD